jgi:hypothetical protein
MVEEGLMRDLTRQVQAMRKKAGLKVADQVVLSIATDAAFAKTVERFKEQLKADTTSKEVRVSVGKPSGFKEEAKFEDKTVWLSFEK